MPALFTQNVDAAEGADDLLDGRANGLGVGSVGMDGERPATRGLDGLDDFVRLGGRGTVGDGDAGALGGEALGDGGTDAA